MIESGARVIGRVIINVFDEEGCLKDQMSTPNTVVTTGRNFMASRCIGDSPTVMSHMAIGSGSTAVAVSDTTLVTQLSRVTLTSSAISTSPNEVKYDASFGAGVGTGAVVEAGLFNASSGGVMLARTVFSVINKGSADTLNISWFLRVT